jgi:hypothetical protein
MGKIIGFYCHIKPKSGPKPPVHWIRTQTGPEPQGSGSAGAWTEPRGVGSGSGTKCPNPHQTGPQTVYYSHGQSKSTKPNKEPKLLGPNGLQIQIQ